MQQEYVTIFYTPFLPCEFYYNSTKYSLHGLFLQKQNILISRSIYSNRQYIDLELFWTLLSCAKINKTETLSQFQWMLFKSNAN